VLIKRLGRQYRIIFNGTNEASNVIKATNALIGSWVTRFD
jgi:hypothetical protein